MSYYGVARGRTIGIFMTWGDCEAQVKGFPGARYKKFNSAASAEEFIKAEGGPVTKGKIKHSYQQNDSKTSNNNLKRTYSTSYKKPANLKNVKQQLSTESESSSYQWSGSEDTSLSENMTSNSQLDFSDNLSENMLSNSQQDYSDDLDDFPSDDDLNTIIVKQLDDIEKRVNQFEKGIDKIIKKKLPKSAGRKAILIEPPQPKKKRSNTFEKDSNGFVQVYTDGACSGNGRLGARAGLGVFWGEDHHLNTSKPVSGRATNNCGEIQAATHAIQQALDNGVSKLAINTDSQFLINSVTKWMPGWKRKGWKLKTGEPVKNEKDFKELDELQHQLQIKWNYVEAHRGVHGNEMADQLAKAGAVQYQNK